jgi:type IV pilus assembly protein PilV
MSMNLLPISSPVAPRSGRRALQRGVTLLEVLVSILVLLFGMLGMAGVQVRATQAEFESYQRTQALVLLHDMVDRLQANRLVASCYAFTSAATGAPFAGTGAAIPACTAGSVVQQATANADLAAWSNALLGATEVQAGNNIGAMLGARGCVTAGGGDVYTVTVAWQGLSPTAAAPAALTCGTGLYGSDDALRRVVSTTLRVATLF